MGSVGLENGGITWVQLGWRTEGYTWVRLGWKVGLENKCQRCTRVKLENGYTEVKLGCRNRRTEVRDVHGYKLGWRIQRLSWVREISSGSIHMWRNILDYGPNQTPSSKKKKRFFFGDPNFEGNLLVD